MRDLWRKTVEMFWEHPVLWLPYIVVQLWSFILDAFSNWSARAIMHSLVTSHSVLGAETTSYTHLAYSKAMLYSAPISALIHFANVGAMVCSFLLIARMLQFIAQANDAGFASACAELRDSSRRVVWFSFKFCLCMIASVVIAGIPALLPALHVQLSSGAPFEVVNWTCSLMAILAVAWVVAPMALRLLMPRAQAIDPARQWIGRKCALWAAGTSGLMSLAYDSTRHGIRVHSVFEGDAVGALAGLVVNAPLLLLFIAFALLVDDPQGSEEPTSLPAPEPVLPN